MSAEPAQAPAVESDAVPWARCLQMIGLAIIIIALSLLWTWVMARRQGLREDLGLAGNMRYERSDYPLFAGQGQAQRLAERQLQLRDAYFWKDREHGQVHIPVEVGMQIYLNQENH